MEIFLLDFRELLKNRFRFFLLLLRSVVDEEDAVQVVDFMLKTPRQQPPALTLDFLPVQQRGFQKNFRWARNVPVDPRQRQATFAKNFDFRRR